jgi:hypothetical protein
MAWCSAADRVQEKRSLLEGGERPDRGTAALTRLDAAHGQDQRPFFRPGAPSHLGGNCRVGRLETGGVDPVVHDLGVGAVLVAEEVPPVLADDQDPVRLQDGLALGASRCGRPG